MICWLFQCSICFELIMFLCSNKGIFRAATGQQDENSNSDVITHNDKIKFWITRTIKKNIMENRGFIFIILRGLIMTGPNT